MTIYIVVLCMTVLPQNVNHKILLEKLEVYGAEGKFKR